MSPLTAEQQALVTQHMALVRMQVGRQLQRMPSGPRKREREDLIQEGTLGLMQAAARYEPRSCGTFAPYALAFIHGALCRYLLRQMDGLAIPTTLALELVRERRAAEAQADLALLEMGADTAAEAPRPRRRFAGPATILPQFYNLETSDSSLAKMAYRRAMEKEREQENADANSEANPDKTGWTIEQLHERYEQALQWAVKHVKDTPMARIDHEALVQSVVQERLAVPEGHFRTARRALAQRFGCTPTRVWNLEMRITRLVQHRLASDAGLVHEAATVVCQPGTAWSQSPQTAPAVAGDRAGAVKCLAVRHVLPGSVGTIG